MKFGMQIDYAGGFAESAAKVAEFEKAGLDIAWVAEAYGFDAPTFMGYLAAKTDSITIGAGILPGHGCWKGGSRPWGLPPPRWRPARRCSCVCRRRR